MIDRNGKHIREDDIANELGISITAFREIKFRLGYKGWLTKDELAQIEKVVADIKERCGVVTAGYVTKVCGVISKKDVLKEIDELQERITKDTLIDEQLIDGESINNKLNRLFEKRLVAENESLKNRN